jgi:predicted nucleic acid-binding protein
MPIEPLPKIPAGSNVFLDANILIYALGARSAECLSLLHRCASEEITGVTSLHVISEVTHRLMMKEAQAKGLAGADPRKTLNKHPERVRQLVDYWKETERLLSLNLLILPLEENAIHAAQLERVRYGLLNNDSLIVACMRLYGISQLATHDAGFERVSSISAFSPADV